MPNVPDQRTPTNQSKREPASGSYERGAVAAVFVVTTLWLTWYSVTQLEYSAGGDIAKWGQFGDSFGGLNSIFSAITVAFVAWAGLLQRSALIDARRALDDQKKATARQQFEGLFFEMLRLASDASSRIEFHGHRRGVAVHRIGASALNSLAALHFGKPAKYRPSQAGGRTLMEMVEIYKRKIYDEHPSQLGPYFRLLYQTFSIIESEPNLTPEERIRYSKIARGQLSEGALLLLALNALTTRGTKFIRLIEESGLLEHMHPAYL